MEHSNGITAIQLPSLDPFEFGKETVAAASCDMHRNLACNRYVPVAEYRKEKEKTSSPFFYKQTEYDYEKIQLRISKRYALRTSRYEPREASSIFLVRGKYEQKEGKWLAINVDKVSMAPEAANF
ncbi:hypothetical protein F3Y22_tig00010533pilonHSYRG00051 [Hibiscus syriacus]|uniref:Uncharacterized protein n=1 Tax=Hibiscus syriacus TaxID=106335 RepID=A0A6A3CAL7_HIBSY|nr:hypothetical protein F3Y22_tig00010533pilonHSYRG00051 [Hibiscus syriacus]